jgi:hypothetical protein
VFRRRYLRAYNKKLLVFTASYSGVRPPDCAVITRPIFRVLAPHLTEVGHMLIIRDTPGLSTTSRHEALVSIPSWPSTRSELTRLIARELHRLARRQNAGDDTTVGDALLSSGFAAWFALLLDTVGERSDEEPVDRVAILAAIALWDRPVSDAAWNPAWTTPLGLTIVRRVLLGTFDLRRSLVDGPTPAFRLALERLGEE